MFVPRRSVVVTNIHKNWSQFRESMGDFIPPLIYLIPQNGLRKTSFHQTVNRQPSAGTGLFNR